jgi:hypothetical protein
MSAYEGRSIFDLPSIFSYYLISSSLKRKKKKKLFQSFNDLIVQACFASWDLWSFVQACFASYFSHSQGSS